MTTRQTLIASVRDGEAARRAVAALSLHGVDGRNIDVLEPATATRDRDRPRGVGAATDGRVAAHIGRRWLAGAAVGATVGAAAAMIALSFMGTGTTVLGAGVAGAFAGAMIGVLVSLLSIPTMVPAWERTHGHAPGSWSVVVSDIDASHVPQVRRVLSRHAERISDQPGTQPSN